MRKAGTQRTIEDAIVGVDMGIESLAHGAEVFLPFVDRNYGFFFDAKTSIENKRDANRKFIQEGVSEYMNAYNELKQMQAPELTQESVRGANNIYRQLKAHTFIDRVNFVSKDSFVVYTKLLFGDVRVEGGSRTNVRRCLGAYKIVVSMKSYDANIKVYNILYPKSIYAHYAVKNNMPCFGDFNYDIREMLSERNVYGIADMMIHFLRFAEDGSAWRPSHEWIKQRIKATPQITGSGRVRENASLVMLYDSGEFEEGKLYKVERSYNGWPVLLKSDGGEYTVDDMGYFAIIKNIIFKKASSLQDIEAMYFDKLDALPDGATLAEALEILPK